MKHKLPIFFLGFLLLLFSGCVQTNVKSKASNEGRTSSTYPILPQAAVAIITDILEVNNDRNIHVDLEEERELNGKLYYIIQEYILSKPFDDGSMMTGTLARFAVDKESGAAYKWDINTNELVPVGKLRILFMEDEDYKKAEEIGRALFSEVSYFSTWFAERDGLVYYIYGIPNKPHGWTNHNYFYYSLATGDMYRWNIDDDSLVAVGFRLQ